MIKIYIFYFLFLTHLSDSETLCNKGCLRCAKRNPNDDSKVCVLCDTVNNFYLTKEFDCEKSQIENCEVIDLHNNCL